jgi:hypothetical protein
MVINRAKEVCEYCLLPQALSFLVFEVEHVISEKHNGRTTKSNLALACPICNRFKGSDLGSLDPKTGKLTPFFNPRNQRWSEHFKLENGKIIPLSPEGRVTVLIFHFNNYERVIERLRIKIDRGRRLPASTF